MAIDSAAELLFNISANADEATENIVRFRALMGQNLEDLAEQVQDWSDEMIGEITSVQGAMTAGFAGMAAGLVAVAAGVHESMKEYGSYAEQIDHAMRVTGMTAEQLSVLHSAAKETEVDWDTMVKSLTLFEHATVMAAQGSKEQREAFHALGITDKEIIAGQKDIWPLLMKVTDGFHNNASEAQRATISRDLFSRGGTVLIEMLRKGSDWFKEAAEKAKSYGLVLSTQDVMAAREFRAAQHEMQEQLEGITVTIGQHLMPWLEKLEALSISVWQSLKPSARIGDVLGSYKRELAEIKKEAATAVVAGIQPPMLDDTKVKKVKEDFEGLTSLADTLSSKMASLSGNKWQELASEVTHYQDQLAKATTELEKLKKTGGITADAAKRETAVLAQIPALIARVVKETAANIAAEDTKAWGEAVQKSIEFHEQEDEEIRRAGEARVEVDREISDKVADQQDEGYARERSSLIAQQNAWAASLAKKVQLTADDWNKIDQITMEGLARIDKTETAAWQEEMSRMREHLDSIVAADATEKEKLAADYQRDLERYSQVEEQKALKAAQTEAQRYQIEQMYATLRQQINQKYMDDLQKLVNSQGWQGVFGNVFAEHIRQNQTLMRQWQTSTNQSLLMVQVSLQSLKEMAQQTFQTFVQGMAQSMTQAIETGKSIGQSMKQVLEATLESIAGQAMVQAIYATGLGFLDLAEQNYGGAAQAFTSAAIFGSIAVGAAVAGKALGGGSADGSGGSGGSGDSGGSSKSSYGSPGGAVAGAGAQQQQGTVNITVNGHIFGTSGIAELTDMINQAVFENNTQLYASHNPQGVPL